MEEMTGEDEPQDEINENEDIDISEELIQESVESVDHRDSDKNEKKKKKKKKKKFNREMG